MASNPSADDFDRLAFDEFGAGELHDALVALQAGGDLQVRARCRARRPPARGESWSLSSTVATRRPFASFMSAVAGSSKTRCGDGNVSATCAYIPAISSPSGFGTRTSVFIVRVVASSSPAARATLPWNVLPGYSRTVTWRGDADADAGRHVLRNLHEHARRIGGRDPEQRLPVAGGDQRARLDPALGDGAGEGRRDPREGLELHEAADVRLLRGDGRLGDVTLASSTCGLRLLLIEVLLRRDALRRELLVSLQVARPTGWRLAFERWSVRLGLRELRPGLLELLIELRASRSRRAAAPRSPCRPCRPATGARSRSRARRAPSPASGCTLPGSSTRAVARADLRASRRRRAGPRSAGRLRRLLERRRAAAMRACSRPRTPRPEERRRRRRGDRAALREGARAAAD